MKSIKLMKNGVVRQAVKWGACASALLFAGVSYAADPDTNMSLGDLQANIAGTSNTILRIILTVITIAGILLVIKGIVHLKQNYTGSGQEKHLSKGLASLGFGAALFIAVPITHMLVQGLSGTHSNIYDSWESEQAAQSLS